MKIGILGGGQLGRMLLQASINYPVTTYVLENDVECPAAHLCHHFTKGNIQDFDTVYQFGKGLDAITIEIESVNIEALILLEREGVRIYPSTSALSIIKNKVLQKQFYQDNNFPTASFVITESRDELNAYEHLFPAIHKVGEGGYDGKGVKKIANKQDIVHGFDAPAVLEEKIAIVKELAVIIGVSQNMKVVAYPPVEMVFDSRYHLLDFQLCPAQVSDEIISKSQQIAREVVKKLNSPGIFAVELFINHEGELLINEMAPRAHNSGHHTIEASFCSQFDMLWRIMLGLPLGNTALIMPSVLINLVGEPKETGTVKYEGLPNVLSISNAFVHLYGKKETKPGRKMGHVTLLHTDIAGLQSQAEAVKSILKIKAVRTAN